MIECLFGMETHAEQCGMAGVSEPHFARPRGREAARKQAIRVERCRAPLSGRGAIERFAAPRVENLVIG
jgi:hypothetical protein